MIYTGAVFYSSLFIFVMNDLHNTKQEKVFINTKSLIDVAIYLSGVKDGKGNLLPLGTVVLDDLWNAIKYLQGDNSFISKRDNK